MPKKTSSNFIARGLQSVDLFEENIKLNLDGEEGLKSWLGGLVSAAIIIFLFVQVIIQSVSILNREDPTIVQAIDVEDDPLQINFNETTNFIFAISILKNNVNVNMTEGSAISFSSQYTHQIRALDGTLSKQRAALIWSPCVPSNFSTTVFPESTYSAYSLKYAYCPTMMNYTNKTTGECPANIREIYPNCLSPFEFSLQGNFLSFNFKYLQVALHSCTDADALNIRGLHCAADTSTAFNNAEFKVNLYYANTLINPVDYEVPNRTYIDTIYWSVNPTVYKLADIYVDAVTVQDYDDFFSNDDNRNRSYFSLNSDTMRETQVFRRTDFLELNLRRSNANAITIRKYQKVLDVVSNIGGISEVLIVAGAIIALGYTKYRHQTILSNKLYDFPPNDKKDKRKNKKKDSSQKTTGKSAKAANNNKKTGSTNTSSQKLGNPTVAAAKGGDKSDEDLTTDTSILTGKEKRLLDFGGLSYLREMFSSMFGRKDPDTVLSQKARAQVTRDLDVTRIIDKLKEIDKLKRILLSRHQREAFNFIEKPLITVKDDKPVQRDSICMLDSPTNSPKKGEEQGFKEAIKNDYGSMSKYARLYMAYTLLKADNDPRNWKFNKKIMNMISEDVIQLFQKVDEYFGDTPDPMRFDEAVKRIRRKGAEGNFATLDDVTVQL